MNTPKPKRKASQRQIDANTETANLPRDMSDENMDKRADRKLVRASTRGNPETIIRLLLRQYIVGKDMTKLSSTEATIFTKWLELLVRIYEFKDKVPVEKKDPELKDWLSSVSKPRDNK